MNPDEGHWLIPGAGTQRKALLFQAGEGHVLVAILGRNGGTQASMVLDVEHAEEAFGALRRCAREAWLRDEERRDRLPPYSEPMMPFETVPAVEPDSPAFPIIDKENQ